MPEVTKAQLLKYVVWAMVDVEMNLMPLKVIRMETCLRAKGLSRLSKDHGPKRRTNTLWKEESKEIKDYMKVENGGVHHKRYDGCCMKEQVKIPKATWTSCILKKRSTCWTSSRRASLMKDDVKIKVTNGTPKTLILLDGVVNWDGVLKFGGRLDNDHATHFLGWIEKIVPQSLV